ncbi:hypothetical protein [Streptomyces sp. NPDC057909]|uniref:hypothetical protein n=1 Tax=Streptomyces sp. NPDC057909 TaxID=3346277 RepID=UPI0036EB2380
MATKTAPNTFADVIKKAEAEHKKKADTYGADVLAMREKVERFGIEKEQAEEKLNSIRASFTRADDTVSAEEYSTALAATDRAGQLIDGGKRVLKNLESKPVHSHGHVAERIAEAVRAILPSDVEVFSTFADVKAEKTDNAYAIVRQLSPTEFASGREAAEVVVRVHRNPRFAAMLTAEKLARAVEGRGWFVSGAHKPGDRMYETHAVGIDEVRIQEVHVFSAIPILKSDPTEAAAKQAASSLVTDAASRVDVGVPVSFQPIPGGGVRAPQFSIRVKRVRLNSKTVKGERQTEVIAEVAFQTNTLSMSVGSIREALRDAAQALSGRFVGNLGVVAEGVATKPLTDPAGAGTSGSEHVVAVRFIAESVTA